MDPHPLQKVAASQAHPTSAPSSPPAKDSGQFARDLIDALRSRGGNAVASTAAPDADMATTSDSSAYTDLTSADPFGFADDGSISTVTVSGRTDRLQRQFTARLDELFTEHGIDTGVPIELRADTFGRIRIVSDHSDNAKIESLFAGSFELGQTFRRLSSAHSLIRAEQQHQAFTTAYADDPRSAAARFAHLFGATSRAAEFRLTLAAGEWTTWFE